MKKLRLLLAGVAVGFLGMGLTGCKDAEEDKTEAPDKTGTEVKTDKPATEPAQQKPKDHPAH